LSLRAKFALYLVFIHLVFGAGIGVLLWERRVWLLAAEAFFLLSFLVSLYLVRALFEPIRLIRSGVDFIRTHDFSTRIRPTGQAELDPLIDVYNRMTDNLRQERIRSEEQEHFLQRILAASPSGILVLDLEGKVTMANRGAAGLLRRGIEELRGRRLTELGSPLADQIADLEPGTTRLIAWQGPRRIRCRALSFMDRGFPRRFLMLEELTEELHRSQKAAYEKLIRMMSHEVSNTAGAVNSLLNSCLAYRDQIAEADRTDFGEALRVAVARNTRMNRFMQDFAEVVRIPAPRKRPCDPREVLEEVARLLKEESETRRVRWEWEVADSLPPVEMDRAQMEQAFINICRNSLEAIGRDGTVTVKLGADRGRPFAVIRDTGGGIPPGIREHLFTPFFTSKENGQGIGLTLVQEVLLGHGFDFSLENDAPGAAAFTILF